MIEAIGKAIDSIKKAIDLIKKAINAIPKENEMILPDDGSFVKRIVEF